MPPRGAEAAGNPERAHPVPMDERRRTGWLSENRTDDDRPIDHDAGLHLGDEEGMPAPVDIRDTHGNAAPAVGTGLGTDVADVDLPDGGPYPLPDQLERPSPAVPPGTPLMEPTRDPSLSRAVDVANAGLDPGQLGFDRAAEGPPPGPLGPDVEAQPADAEGEPAGQWGSSGSSTG